MPPILIIITETQILLQSSVQNGHHLLHKLLKLGSHEWFSQKRRYKSTENTLNKFKNVIFAVKS